MKLSEWLDAERGRAESLAAHLHISKGAVSQWKTNGVPVMQMQAVREFSRGEVTFEDMVTEATNLKLRHAA